MEDDTPKRSFYVTISFGLLDDDSLYCFQGRRLRTEGGGSSTLETSMTVLHGFQRSVRPKNLSLLRCYGKLRHLSPPSQLCPQPVCSLRRFSV